MSENGAIDQDFEDAEQPYIDQVEDALAGVETDPIPGGLALDLVTRQLLFVAEKVAPNLETYYKEKNFDLATYGVNPYLPVSLDDAAFKCVYVSDVTAEKLAGWDDTKTYDFPAGRLAHVPVENAWTGGEVTDVE